MLAAWWFCLLVFQCGIDVCLKLGWLVFPQVVNDGMSDNFMEAMNQLLICDGMPFSL